MISHHHRSIFIHIPKTAGTSIEQKLGHFDAVEDGVQDHRRLRGVEPLSVRAAPTLARRAKAVVRGLPRVDRQQYAAYYKFAFVRDPWDRVGSWFENVRRDPAHQRRSGVPLDCSFAHFVRQRLHSDWALRPQLDWLSDTRGRIGVDFVGRFERLERDFESVATRLGLDDAQLDHLIPGPGVGSYRHLYDDETRTAVTARFADEIELFGYRFGDER